MSDTSTTVTPAHFEYIAARTTPEDDLLRALKTAAEEAGIPAIWIAPEQAALLQILLRLSGAREVVEVGTLAGYSAIAMARALPPDGRLSTIEIDARHADFAESWIARSDVADRVRVLCGAGIDRLAEMKSGTVDAIFIDADKHNYPNYLREAERLLRPGGLLMADNAFAFGYLLDANRQTPDVLAIRDFNDLVARTSAFQSVIVPLGDGCWVGVRR